MQMYISLFHVVTQSFVKNKYSLCLCKKYKNICREKLVLVIGISYNCIGYTFDLMCICFLYLENKI
jgi:hypothetical protein